MDGTEAAFPQQYRLPGDSAVVGVRGLTKLEYLTAMVVSGHASIEDNRSYSSREDKSQTADEWRLMIISNDVKYCVSVARAILAETSATEPT